MISELENKDYYYSKSKHFNKYFVERKKTETEIAKEAELSNMILNFYQKVYDKNPNELHYDMFDYDLCNYGYIDNYGYYIINYDNWGYYLVRFFGDDIHEIFLLIARNILNRKRRENNYKNRKAINSEYKKRFKGIKNIDSIYIAEYDLDKWNRYYDGNIPDELISTYENYVNNDYYLLKTNTLLKYNKEYKQFMFNGNKKIRSLIK